MKRIMLYSFALFACVGVQAQNISEVLQSVEANNKEIQANMQLTKAQKVEACVDNNLPDPTATYTHQWKAQETGDHLGELVVTQGF